MSLGKATEILLGRIIRQVADHGLVLWLDPEGLYKEVLGDLARKDVAVEPYRDGVFELRRRIEPALAAEEPPRLVVYVPLPDTEVLGPLAELAAAAVIMKPGQQPPARNTRLSLIARAALADQVSPEVLDSIVRRAEAGQLSLAEIDRIAEHAGGPAAGTLALIFGTTNASEIALQFLSSDRHDALLAAKSAIPELLALLAAYYEYTPKSSPSPAELRHAFGRYLLGTELAVACGEAVPRSLSELPRPAGPKAVEEVLRLLRAWRHRRDLVASYVERARAVEAELNVGALDLSLAVLTEVETFEGLDERLQETVEGALLERATAEVIATAERRTAGFWAAAVPEAMERWALIAAAGRVLITADRVEAELTKTPGDAAALAAGYVGTLPGCEPWALLDTAHRQLEHRVHHFKFDVTGRHQTMERLIARARQRYSAVASVLAERFVRTLHEADFRIPGWLSQREVFLRHVEPALADGKTAFVLVDGLRYEMVRELHAAVEPDHGVELRPALGTLPSVTEIGMAALLPRAHDPVELMTGRRGKLALRVGGTSVGTREERLDYLAQHVGGVTFTTRLDALLPPNKKTREEIEKARLVVVTATEELDGLCERGNVAMARRLMDDVLLQLQRALGYLFDLGVRTVVVSSDHGYLFGETLDTGNLIDPPGGQVIDLHPRVWVGKGGAASPSYLRVKASDVGLGGDLEIAVPYGLGGFRTAGPSRAYLHGGASPQELIVPVWTVTRVRAARRVAPGAVTWTVTPGSRSVSTRFVSVQVEGSGAGLFDVEPPRIRVEVREGRRVLSRPVAASYGFEEATGLVQMELDADHRVLRANTVTVMLEPPKGRTVEVVLVDATTDRVLAKTALPVTMAAF
jgi:hypothetical protein